MRMTKNRFLLLLTPLLLLTAAAQSRAASNGVRDDAHFFSPGAISQAQQTIDQIERRHSKDVLVETLSTVPEDQKARFDEAGQDQQKREAFFAQWADSRFRAEGVNGVYILVTKNPAHLEISLGNNTRQDRLFSRGDRDVVRTELLNAFRQKNFDQGLTTAVQTIAQRMDANAPARNSGTVSQSAPPRTYNPPSFPRQQPRGWGLGGLACIIIAVVGFIILIRGIFGRSGGSYYGGGGYPQGGGGYQQGGYYPPQGGGYGYGGGGGGGFGRGFLGGLLGGALGGYAADRWMHGGQQSGGGYAPPATGGDYAGGSGAADTGSESSGGDFGDSGGGGGGGGGDWGGGGGGDFGGGGGGDFGGGGGDSGGSSGGDF